MKEMTTEIGSIKILIGVATATAADGTQRNLQVGSPVFAEDIITTGLASAIEIAFVDGSLLDLGGNSQAMLDSDVFDSQTPPQNLHVAQDDTSTLQHALLDGNDPSQIADPTSSGLELDNESNGSGDLIRVEHAEQLFPTFSEPNTVDVDDQILSNAPEAIVQTDEFQNIPPDQLPNFTNEIFAEKGSSTLKASEGADNFVWTKATVDASSVDTVLNFNIVEDTLDLSDLLSDNSHEIEGIEESGYLQIQINTSGTGSLVQSIDLPNIAVGGNAQLTLEGLISTGVINDG